MGQIAKEKLRFAVIGCGAIVKKHMIAISTIESAEIVGAFDTNFEALKSFGEEYAVPTFTNVKEMIEKTDPHILNILTPSGTHGQNILELLNFNRHFVVEKPLALRLDQIEKILEECDERGLKIFVVQQNRFNPPIQKLKEAIDKGRLGKLGI